MQPGVVYFAPPDYHLQIEPERSFSLSLEAPVYFSRPSIDVLLETAACAYRREMLAIILTGASADGAEGLAKVRQLGGGAWVQDPATASSAADAGCGAQARRRRPRAGHAATGRQPGPVDKTELHACTVRR